MNKDACCVVDQFCDAPANLEYKSLPKLRATCFSCGLAVCTKCSTKRKYYHWGKVRLCNNCQIEYDGNNDIVMRRTLKMAGY